VTATANQKQSAGRFDFDCNTENVLRGAAAENQECESTRVSATVLLAMSIAILRCLQRLICKTATDVRFFVKPVN
jgi:hypothetical protein